MKKLILQKGILAPGEEVRVNIKVSNPIPDVEIGSHVPEEAVFMGYIYLLGQTCFAFCGNCRCLAKWAWNGEMLKPAHLIFCPNCRRLMCRFSGWEKPI